MIPTNVVTLHLQFNHSSWSLISCVLTFYASKQTKRVAILVHMLPLHIIHKLYKSICISTNTYKHAYKYSNTNTQAHKHTHTYTSIHIHIQTCTNLHTNTFTNTQTHTCIHTNTYKHAHKNFHKYINANIQTLKPTYTETQMCNHLHSSWSRGILAWVIFQVEVLCL